MTMLLPTFELHQPASLKEAIALAAKLGDDFDYISGGTDLLPNYKCGLNSKSNIISLAKVAELKTLSAREIGAGVTLVELERNGEIPPALAEAAGRVASPLLRESATIGGNLMLDTRCHFFNQSFFWRSALGYCLKADGDVCHVIPKITVDGKSVVNDKICVATHSSDLAPMLIALGAEATLVGPQGERTLKLHEFYRGDGIERFDLKPGEILARVTLPEWAADARAGYMKLAPRRSIDFPVLGVAAALHLADDGTLNALRIGLGACDTTPTLIDYTGLDKPVPPASYLNHDPAKDMPAVIGKPFNEEAIAAVAKHVQNVAQPKLNVPMEVGYRRKMAGVFTRRLLTQLAG